MWKKSLAEREDSFMRPRFKLLILFIVLISFSGCGYTTGSLLPPHIKNVYVESFANNIPITEEVSDQRIYKTYRPRLEIDITRAIIDKFIFDGHLKLVQKKDADVVLSGELIDFRREPTKYGNDDNVEQYRIAISVDMEFKSIKDNKMLWEEKGFTGSEDYYTVGSQARSEESAVADAIDDLARRVVERAIEVW
ncbi:MAG: LPS assembly lipoprotein LptE [Candidatus Omnitrophota bacterium]